MNKKEFTEILINSFKETLQVYSYEQILNDISIAYSIWHDHWAEKYGQRYDQSLQYTISDNIYIELKKRGFYDK